MLFPILGRRAAEQVVEQDVKPVKAVQTMVILFVVKILICIKDLKIKLKGASSTILNGILLNGMKT